MVRKIFAEKGIEKIIDWLLDKKIIETLFSALLLYASYLTDFMKAWAPLSYVVAGIGGFILALIISNLLLERRLKRNKIDEKKESYIEFKYENGIVPTKTQNAYIAHASKTGDAPILLFIIFEESVNYSSIDISPSFNWKKVNFHNQYAIVEIWDVRNGNYKITFI